MSTKAPVTANPHAKERAGLTRWLFRGWKVSKNPDGKEHHEQVTLAVTTQNHHTAIGEVMARLQAEKAEIETVGSGVARKPHAYIAHALAAKTKRQMDANRARASRWVAWAVRQGYVPHATWIALSAATGDSPEARALGLEIDKEDLATCDVVIVCGKRGDLDTSEGMQGEKTYGESIAIRVLEVFTKNGEPPK